MQSLIIAPQWIGDAVMTEPLLRTLSERGEKLTVLAVPWVAPVYEAMAHIDGLGATIHADFQHGGLQWQARRSLAARIKSGEWGHFEKAYVLPNSLKSALLPWLAGIKTRIGYKGEQRYGLLNRRLPNPPRDQRGSMVAHYLKLAQTLANNRGQIPIGSQQREKQLGSDPNWLAALKPKLSTKQTTPNGLTLLVPGAEYGPAKRWGEQNFAALSAQLLQNPQTNIALLGSAKEQALCEAIRDMALRSGADASRINILAGKTNLSEAISLIAGCTQMVSNDSGLMHIAAAFGKPQVAIFGSSNPEHTPPLNDKAKVLWLGYKDQGGLACAPCYQRECSKTGGAHLACMKGVTPTQVMNALGCETTPLSLRDISPTS